MPSGALKQTPTTGLFVAAVLLCPVTASAQDDPALGWSDTAELTVVFTGGNAESSTVGLKNQLKRTWADAVFQTDLGLLRAESTRFTRTAIGTSPASFTVTKQGETALTAENYYVRGRYEREVDAHLFWHVGAGWERNTFTGIDHRYSWVGGVGHTWVDDDQATFRTTYGLTYTVQDDVIERPDGETSFAGLRAAYEYRRRLTPTTVFTSALIADENLKRTGDFRADLTNAVAVSMTSQLALKVSWQLLYDREPSNVGVPLRSPSGVPTGSTVFVALDRVDNFVTFAVVASF